MITSVDSSLAQQIVSTIKDVCNHDINFIDCSGIILASTNESRVGTFHEIGQKVAQSGTALEVTENDSFSGTQKGINMPLYHEGRILAVIGITGEPDNVRQYAYLAQRITNLLIREQELNQYSRRQADKKHFIIQSLIQNDTRNQNYLTNFLQEFQTDPNASYRLILIRINSRYNLVNLSFLEQKIEQMFSMMGITLHTFLYPRDFLAVIECGQYQKKSFILQIFAKENPVILKTAVGKPALLFHLNQSYETSLTAYKTLAGKEENFVLFDELTLEIILSSVTENGKAAFLQKTISGLSEQEKEIMKVYFAEEMSLVKTCDKLFLHKNTLQYRLNHIYEKCGLNPRRFQDAVLLYLALRLQSETKT